MDVVQGTEVTTRAQKVGMVISFGVPLWDCNWFAVINPDWCRPLCPNKGPVFERKARSQWPQLASWPYCGNSVACSVYRFSTFRTEKKMMEWLGARHQLRRPGRDGTAQVLLSGRDARTHTYTRVSLTHTLPKWNPYYVDVMFSLYLNVINIMP